MKKLENFQKNLQVLKDVDFKQANNVVYWAGIVAQFNLTFELAWKALQATLCVHSVAEAATGSPREIIKLGYKVGFISDAEIWLLMLKMRNRSTHIYDEDEIDELVLLIRDRFILAFAELENTLQKKIAEAEKTSWE